MKGLSFPICLSIALIPLACLGQGRDAPEAETERKTSAIEAAYDFSAPDAVFSLDPELDEISGLAVLDADELGAVQDEKGRLYVIRISDGRVARSVKFGKKGDFEGIERVNNTIWALRSDGRLFRMAVPGPDDETVTADEFETELTARHNAEGLAYDAVGNRLLIACKDYPGKGYRHVRAVHAFDLTTAAMAPEPVYLIDLDSLEAHVERPRGESTLRTILRRTFNASDFRPSALAVHPESGRIWVISSTLKALVELLPDGGIAQVHLLTDDRMPQPEGLAIDSDGTIYIATEKARGGGEARLFVFRQASGSHPEPVGASSASQ